MLPPSVNYMIACVPMIKVKRVLTPSVLLFIVILNRIIASSELKAVEVPMKPRMFCQGVPDVL